jgi:(1->4)-alpha-D-glucan 1-alpha-D-glucosylmutase
VTAAPRSTYRLQLTEGFTLEDAAALTEYLKLLGADWVYLSPVLQAETGSTHGYDVTDHGRIDGSRGGRDGFEELVRSCRAAGIGILVDIVPNHVGVATPRHNAWWWDTLRDGRSSVYAGYFDIDWDAGERILIPVLAGPDADGLRIDGGELCYGELRFPIAPGTAQEGDDAHTVHARQHYELVDWHREHIDLNYRRFFAVTSLAAIRVEDPAVFEAAHGEVLRWFRDGEVDGLRIDHPDGLADPGGYLHRLAAAIPSGYIAVEKILESGERLPLDWPVAGTTGYDALGDYDRVLIDPAGEDALSRADGGGADGAPVSFEELMLAAKREVADTLFPPEIARLQREIGDIPTVTDAQARDALAELLACFPVYRSYLPRGLEHLTEAARKASVRRPDLSNAIGRLLPILSDDAHPAARRFEQTTGMVMAKGVEDRAFYRYNRLTSLNEVGGNPVEFSVAPAEFHARQERRIAESPESMTTLSTHDTKRGEDTRARIDVLSEVAPSWLETLGTLRELAPLGDPALENLLWQAVVGSWPASRERLHGYAEKAAREASVSTNWEDPDQAFEERMHRLVDAVFDDPAVAAVVETFVEQIREAGWSNGLSAKLLQLTTPGIPDVYQGSELWERSLVDPDNRRPVDFGQRQRMLDALRRDPLPPVDESGAAKLLLVSRTLRLRRDHPELFTIYRPLHAVGRAAEHALAFDRGGAVAVATRLPVSLRRDGGWGDTELELAEDESVDVLTGRLHRGSRLRVADILHAYPVALLVPAWAHESEA